MKKMAKVAAMLAALALLFGAIGCSSDGDEGSSPPSPPPIYDDGGSEDNYDSENIEYDHSLWDIEYGCLEKYKGRETDVEIPDGVKDINNYAFKDCVTVRAVTIPKSVTGIGYDAFWDCASITSIYYRGTKEEWKKINILDSTGKKHDYVHLTNEGALIYCYNADLGIYEIFQEYAYGMWL